MKSSEGSAYNFHTGFEVSKHFISKRTFFSGKKIIHVHVEKASVKEIIIQDNVACSEMGQQTYQLNVYWLFQFV